MPVLWKRDMMLVVTVKKLGGAPHESHWIHMNRFRFSRFDTVDRRRLDVPLRVLAEWLYFIGDCAVEQIERVRGRGV
jgi:hypothetical protein